MEALACFCFLKFLWQKFLLRGPSTILHMLQVPLIHFQSKNIKRNNDRRQRQKRRRNQVICHWAGVHLIKAEVKMMMRLLFSLHFGDIGQRRILSIYKFKWRSGSCRICRISPFIETPHYKLKSEISFSFGCGIELLERQ